MAVFQRVGNYFAEGDGLGLATGALVMLNLPSGATGISSTQVFPGAKSTGDPAASVRTIGEVAEALDQVASIILPPEKTQALPVSTITVLGILP